MHDQRTRLFEARPVPDEVALDHAATVSPVRRAVRALARNALRAAPPGVRRRLAVELLDVDPHAVLQPLGARLNRAPQLATMPFDLDPADELEFEDLAGLFSSSILNHGIVGMTIRQLAYVFGLARRMGARSAVEIGRWRGGSTIALAAAMGPDGTVWSIDNGEKAARVLGLDPHELDAQTRSLAERFGLSRRAAARRLAHSLGRGGRARRRAHRRRSHVRRRA
jgi:hypothetical protein